MLAQIQPFGVLGNETSNGTNVTPPNATNATTLDNTASTQTKRNSTPIIVGVVVGVGGALLVACVVVLCLLRLRRRGKEEKSGSATESEVSSQAAGDQDRAVASDAPRLPATPMRHRIVQEQDAVGASRHMPPPPSYAGGSGIDASASVARLPAPASALPPSGASSQSQTPVRPTLKADYVAAFCSSPPSPSSGSGPSRAPLKADYARAFGSTSSLQTPSSSSGHLRPPVAPLKTEYAQAFASDIQSSPESPGDRPNIVQKK